MQTVQGKAFNKTTGRIAAALFLDGVSVSDAVAELRQAGFTPDQIGIAISECSESKGKPDMADPRLRPTVEQAHSLVWKLRHGFEEDLHRQGAELMEKQAPIRGGGSKTNPACMKLGLADTLRKFGVGDERIRLMEQEVGEDGALLLVDAGSRIDQAETILERNRGWIRSDMATETGLSAHDQMETAE